VQSYCYYYYYRYYYYCCYYYYYYNHHYVKLFNLLNNARKLGGLVLSITYCFLPLATV